VPVESYCRKSPSAAATSVLRSGSMMTPLAIAVAFPVEVMSPVKFAFVVTVPAVSPEAVPVMFVPTSVEGVPRFGVTSVGEVPKTSAPLPVSPVTAAARFALDGVARNVATFVPSPEIPVLTGRPVASARLNAGVASALPSDTETPPNETALFANIAFDTAPVSIEQVVPLQVNEPKSALARLSGLIAFAVISCPESERKSSPASVTASCAEPAAANPSEVVATHSVPVPVVWST